MRIHRPKLGFKLEFYCLTIMQEAALKLGVLSEEDFDKYVVPEKMIGPSD